VFGFKPTVGLVSRRGMFPLVPSQDSPDDRALDRGSGFGNARDRRRGSARHASMSSAFLNFGSKRGAATEISRVRLGIPRRLLRQGD